MLAEGMARGSATFDITFLQVGCCGERRATVEELEVIIGGIISEDGRMTVNGPGQNDSTRA